jgi:phosphatidate cytidylyltransferase
MSPREALQSPVALFYIALTFGLLLVAGVVFGVWRQHASRAGQSYRGWLFIVPVTALALFLGRETTIIFFTCVALLAFREFALATGMSGDWYLTGGVCLGIIAVGVVTVVPDPTKPALGWFDAFMTLPVFVTAGIVAVPVLRDRVHGQLHAVAVAVLGFLYFGWMLGHLAFLANTKHAYAYLLYLLFAVEINDIAAFLAGRLFGRHSLRTNISPKKTSEGSLGALAVSLTLPWLLWFTFPHFQWQDLLVVGLIVGVGGQVGDLAISVMKRDVGIKDMGAMIPGHGGILDRIDSLVYVAPLFFHYIRYRHGFDWFA